MPQLLAHYRVRLELGARGDQDLLVFSSETRRIAIRGRRFQDFLDHVVPLLDGSHSLEEIVAHSSETFDPDDLTDTIALLAEHKVVVDAQLRPVPTDEDVRLAPQLSYLHEVSNDPSAVRRRLAEARVTVVGVGSVGVVAATALAAANVGHIRCVDDGTVSAADPHLAQLFDLSDVGAPRADVTGAKIRAINPTVSVGLVTSPLSTVDDVAGAVEGSDFVLGCLDPGLAAVTDLLNRACLAQGIPWSQGTASAFEGVVGPTVIPHETACYACYQSRAIACREDPQDALRELEARYADQTDMSAVRENLPFTVGAVGNLLALQAFQLIVGIRPKSTGRVLVLDPFTTTLSEHVVLRKPWCSACFPPNDDP